MKKLLDVFGLRVKQSVEKVRGHCIFSIKLRGGKRFGLIFSDDWSEFFIGVFQKGWDNG